MIFEKLKIEFFATFILTYLSGLFLIEHQMKQTNQLGVGIGIFVAYLILTWSCRSISGAHFNPIISISLAITSHMNFRKALLYAGFHLAAALAAVSFLRMAITNEVAQSIAQNSMLGYPLNLSVHPARQLFYELFGGFFLVFFYYILFLDHVAPRIMAAIGIGGIHFGLLHLMLNRSGAGLNPARMIAYSFIGGQPAKFYIWFVGPLIGGILGGLAARPFLNEAAPEYLRKLKEEKARVRLEEKRAVDKFK